MERILFGDNQFFAVNHLSDEKSRAQAVRFKDDSAIIKVLDTAIDCDINTFMCTTHDRIANICDHIRKNPDQYANFQIYPCMPYAHKYANAVTELGIMGALKEYMPSSNLLGTLAKGGLAVFKKDFISIMEILVDTEMKMFKGVRTDVIFIQNVITDLILGLGMYDFFRAFSDYVKKKYNAEAGFITMNLPLLQQALEKVGIENPIICASINKVGFRMTGGVEAYERTLREKEMRVIAMQVFAAGAIPPKEALEFVCNLPHISSILFGASSRGHIEQNRDLINQYWKKDEPVLV